MNTRDRHQLDDVLTRLEEGIRFLLSDKVTVCKPADHCLAFYDKDGNGIYPIDKQIGSNLCQLYNARDRLKRLLTPQR